MFRRILTTLLSLTMIWLLVACGGNSQTTAGTTGDDNTLSGTLEIAGSTSVAPLAQDLADAFMALHQGVTVNVQSIGSSAGIRAPVDGAAPIGMTSRNLKEEEKTWGLTEYVIAIDGIAIVIHPDNTAVTGLTLEQVKQIYTGEIKNWQEVGGDDAQIIVVSREEGSGTRGAFEEIVDYAGELRDDALIGDGNGSVKSNLITNKNAIAYLSLGFIDEQTKLIEINGYKGTVENIQTGNYPVSRPLIMITKGDVDALAQAYLDFALSDAGQQIAAVKYIPIK